MGDFQKGDVVALKSGSPAMTVEEVHDDGRLSCIWYDSTTNTVQGRLFSYECLDLSIPVKPDTV
jgi:uncharacterized protein YodC (DUF2158 family)